MSAACAIDSPTNELMARWDSTAVVSESSRCPCNAMTCEVKVKGWSLAALVAPSFQSGDWNRDADADRGLACAVTGPVLSIPPLLAAWLGRRVARSGSLG